MASNHCVGIKILPNDFGQKQIEIDTSGCAGALLSGIEALAYAE